MELKPLIVFSGGLDSTYMLEQALKEGDVYTCYFKGSQSPDKIPLELMVRRNIISYLQEKTGHQVLRDEIIDLTKGLMPDIPDGTWGQAFQWLFGLMYVSNGNRHSEIQMGNVLGDSISRHLDDIAQAWHYLQKFSKEKSVPLVFPLALISKDRILNELEPELITKVWVCEMPYIDRDTDIAHPCGQCAACRTMLKTIWMWEHQRGRNFKEFIEQQIAYKTKPPNELTESEIINQLELKESA